MSDIRKITYIQMILVFLFLIFKLTRGEMLDSSNSFVVTLGLSFPNLVEGIIGVLVLTSLGLCIFRGRVKTIFTYTIALVTASFYVISQELKFHNIGGNNVYDSVDVVFSGIGLLIGFGIILYLRPSVEK